MKPKPEELLPIYRRQLAIYEEQGDEERIRIERALIAALEKRLGK